MNALSLTGSTDSLDDQPDPERSATAGRQLGRAVLRHPTASLTVVLIAIMAVFTADSPAAFATESNAINILLDGSGIMLLAVGMTFLIVSGGLDLSIGSVLVFASVICADSMSGRPDTWLTVGIGLVAATASGLLWGAINGMLIAKLRLSPLIVTLGTLGAAQGLADIISHGVDLTTIPAKMSSTIGVGTWLGIPWILWITALITLGAGAVLRLTKLGAQVYAIGSSEEAARRSGIRVDKIRIGLYTMTGVLAGLTAFLLNARFGTTTIAGHDTDNLEAITAVILGGASLSGGVGTMTGTVVGVMVPAVLTNGFTIIGIQSFWQEVAVGAVLIIAVYLDRVRRRSRERY